MDFNNLNEQNTQPTKQNDQDKKIIIKKQKKSGYLANKINKVEDEIDSLYSNIKSINSKIKKKEKELARLRQEFKELF